MGAVTRTFCNGLNLSQYVELGFAFLTNRSINNLPECYLRNAIAHFTHMICRWKCFLGTNQRQLKEFYVRCTILLLQSETFQTFENILKSIVTVAYATSEIQAEDGFDFLIKLIENRNFDVGVEKM